MLGRIHKKDRYHCILVYTKLGKILSYETLMLTDKDLERFRERAQKNQDLEVDRPRHIDLVLWSWLVSWVIRK